MHITEHIATASVEGAWDRIHPFSSLSIQFLSSNSGSRSHPLTQGEDKWGVIWCQAFAGWAWHTGDKGPFIQGVHVDYIGVTGIKWSKCTHWPQGGHILNVPNSCDHNVPTPKTFKMCPKCVFNEFRRTFKIRPTWSPTGLGTFWMSPISQCIHNVFKMFPGSAGGYIEVTWLGTFQMQSQCTQWKH
jgi:hypothetical protein